MVNFCLTKAMGAVYLDRTPLRPRHGPPPPAPPQHLQQHLSHAQFSQSPSREAHASGQEESQHVLCVSLSRVVACSSRGRQLDRCDHTAGAIPEAPLPGSSHSYEGVS